jgi:thiol:disulfide interchange protein
MPNGILNDMFQFNFAKTDLANIFRAIMGVYLAAAMFWIVGIKKSDFWIPATLSNILFMLGLAFGRIISILFDGPGSHVFILALIAEIILAIWGIVNLRNYK